MSKQGHGLKSLSLHHARAHQINSVLQRIGAGHITTAHFSAETLPGQLFEGHRTFELS
jgi:hypothetical protein